LVFFSWVSGPLLSLARSSPFANCDVIVSLSNDSTARRFASQIPRKQPKRRAWRLSVRERISLSGCHEKGVWLCVRWSHLKDT
jgi:hypothetical protein